MKERPILFSAPMVRAILDGTKTQTRRVVKPQPKGTVFHDGQWLDGGYGEAGDTAMHCPYGQPGDRLWVRETWGYRCGIGVAPTTEAVIEYRADGERITKCVTGDQRGLPKQTPGMDRDQLEKWWKRWRPSIFMPYWASRITLEITDVRVQRLWEMSSDDAFAEGIDTEGDWYVEGENLQSAGSPCSPERYAFASLWRSINGDESWEANPWVWALTFQRVQP